MPASPGSPTVRGLNAQPGQPMEADMEALNQAPVILLVEDDADDAFLIQQALQEALSV